MPRRVAVILGAGSSYDCIDPSGTVVNSEFRPPLVGQLFDSRPPFNKILSQFPAVESISEEFRTKLRNGMNLESLLSLLHKKSDIARKRQFWEVPLYLQRLLWEISNSYVVSGVTKFHTLVNVLVDSQYEEILFLTLNYDLFLEQALSRIVGLQFNTIESYGVVNQRWCVVKLHGSVNWGSRLVNQPLGTSSWPRILAELKETPKLGNEIRIFNDTRDSLNLLDGVFFYPRLGIPFEGKDEFYCPKQHVEIAMEFLSGCSDFLVIGFSALDEYVVKLFKSVKQISKLKIVNGKQELGRDTLNRLADHLLPIENQWFRNWQDCCYDGGFLNFTYNAQHESFLLS